MESRSGRSGAMRPSDQAITAQGLLSVVAIASMLAYAGYTMQLGHSESVSASAQVVQAGASAQRAAYTGTVVQLGSGFLLRDPAGTVYQLDDASLDDASKAQAFAGKSVKVTGRLDQMGQLIHVERIEEMRA